MTLKQYLQEQLRGTVVITLPLTGKVYQWVDPANIVYKMRAIVSQLPDDFDPDDNLPGVDYPNDNDEIARENLKKLIQEWREQHKEVQP